MWILIEGTISTQFYGMYFILWTNLPAYILVFEEYLQIDTIGDHMNIYIFFIYIIANALSAYLYNSIKIHEIFLWHEYDCIKVILTSFH